MSKTRAPTASSDSSFVGPPAERRYSVRFLQGIETRLKGFGLTSEFAAQLHHRFATLGRAGVDHEGRLLDSWLASANPVPAALLYAQLQALQSAVTPGGFRVGPNPLGSWTVTPPEGEAFELTQGQTRRLSDGAVVTIRGRQLTMTGAADALLDADWASSAAEFTLTAQRAVLALFAEAQIPLPRALSALASAAAPAGMAKLLPGLLVAGGLPNDPAEHPRFFQTNSDWVASLALSLAALNVVCSPAADPVLTLLRIAAHSVAPSRRADPELERAVLLTELASHSAELVDPSRAEGALTALKAFAAKIRGDARERLKALISSPR